MESASIGHTNNLIIENIFLSLSIILIKASFQTGALQLCGSGAPFLCSILLFQTSVICNKTYVIRFSHLMLLIK